MASGTTTFTSASPSYQQSAQNVWQTAQDLAGQSFVPYKDPRIAGWSPDERRAFNMTRNFVGQNVGSGALGQAIDTTTGLARGGSFLSNIGDYLNPYTQNVVDTTLGELSRQRDLTAAQNAADAAKAGAFGGDRSAILDAELQRNYLNQAATTSGQLFSDAYNNASTLAYQDADLQRRSAAQLADLANMQRQFKGQDIDMLSALGAQRRAQNQAGLDLDYQEFLREQQYPIDRYNILASGFSGLPVDTTTTTSISDPRTNPWAAATGGALTGASLFGQGGPLSGTSIGGHSLGGWGGAGLGALAGYLLR